jgi:hypothetical protein
MGNRSLYLLRLQDLLIVFTLQSRPTPKSLELFPDAFDGEYFNYKRDWLHYYGSFAHRIGSGAELGSMRVTEQIDAMEVSGTNLSNISRCYTNYGNHFYAAYISVFWRCYSSFGSYQLKT